ncbi:hypothetical protein CAPTEDRAFT_203344 [Capitella teleta]|uniref:Uncharacterized protein n=1 Tax=Capitella teleta TaxID=283909 RepID=R7V980_CAPTE|nr:hypothetical protein CAPTEDRAFT_203344 [Capitella teleta]|eukprot:ELU15403.1 hypothetical protein CAPTEDRAFT_203344 [Capitella teleta]
MKKSEELGMTWNEENLSNINELRTRKKCADLANMTINKGGVKGACLAITTTAIRATTTAAPNENSWGKTVHVINQCTVKGHSHLLGSEDLSYHNEFLVCKAELSSVKQAVSKLFPRIKRKRWRSPIG